MNIVFEWMCVKAMDNSVFDKYRDRIIEGSIVSTIVWLGLPIMIVNLVHISYNIADAYWLSKYSDIALAVPQQVWPSFMLFHSLSAALSVANQALISQYIGARRYGDASSVASKLFTTSFILGIILCLSYIILRPFIFGYIVSTPKEIYDDVMVYSGIIAIGMFFAYLVMVYTTILQGIGDTRTPALITGLSALTNIVLDPFLILGIGPFPRLGVVGAAVATVFSRFLALPALAFVVKKRFRELRVWFTRSIDLRWALSNIRIGLPILVLLSTSSLAFMFLVKLVNMFGIVVVTAYSIGFIILQLADASLRGFSQAVSIMVGQCIGAGKDVRAREVAWKSVFLVFSTVFIASTILYLFRDPFIHVFTSDESIWLETRRFLEIFIWSIPFFGLFIVGMSIGRGSGHTSIPTVIGIIRLWAIRIGGGYLLALLFRMGSTGIWTAMLLSNITAGLLAVLWVSSGNWVKPVIEGYETVSDL